VLGSGEGLSKVRVGVDVGGTFNDYVAVRGDEVFRWKELGRAPRQAQIAESIGAHLTPSDRLTEVVYGSTLAVNALLERKHPAPALITTAGFEDLLDLRRQRRPDLYRSWIHHPDPVIPRSMRFGVAERTGPRGEIIAPLTRREVDRAVNALPSDLGAVAVCLLHSYINPTHELLIEESLRRLRPDLSYVLSCKTFPEIREYEQISSVAAEAYLLPIFDDYLTALEAAIRSVEPTASVWVMQSGGGRLGFESARSNPTRTVMSGPAGGVVAAKLAGQQIDTSDLITFDVGGTSADVALVRDGEAVMIYERELEGLPLLGASIDVHSIGAGGGSVLSVDEGGLLHVGPRSAGAFPGPACYGLGGAEPTLSDAHLVLGRLPVTQPLAGGLTLNENAAWFAMTAIAAQMMRGVEEVAEAAIDIANSNMVNAIRLVSVERGYDPRAHTLVAFGGAGPLHAAEVADRLGITTVLVPFGAGVLSALGSVAAQPRADASKSVLAGEDEVDLVQATIDDLVGSLAPYLPEGAVRPGIALVTIDMKYVGQNWVISVPLVGKIVKSQIRRAFEKRYRALYGILLDRPISYVTVRVALLGDEAGGPTARLATRDSGDLISSSPHRVYHGGEWLAASLWRGGISEGGVAGTAVVCLPDTTIFVPAGTALIRCAAGYLFTRRRGIDGQV
jgi:N-methylhydantoinase A